ncbi:MAG TPA: molybdopterin cofactor-binding domain-containing protein, partial [Steroidobacteraceae bacterium]|nr:molybdopterin cofactor-binding domain-containing protein [Steroidobacteraceae bacterium]
MDELTAKLHSRRHFIQLSALVGGGLVLGIELQAARATQTSHLPPRAAAALNAYVRIDSQGRITLVMPKVEMGQGTYTSLPMLIAEELEVELDAVTVEPAPPDPTVYGVDGDQSTGGSTSIRDCWLPLRKAGAAARMMLIGAAAHKWRVPVSACRAEGGMVFHDGSARRISYGS